MQPCKYVGFTKCEKCEIPFHNQCKKFLQVHAKWLLNKLLKDKAEAFKFTPVKDAERYNVICSRVADVAKSIALQFALQKNEPVIPITSNVAMDMIMRKTEIEPSVVYLHVKMAVGEVASIVGMLESFCDWVEKDGGKVAVFLDNCSAYTLKYKSAEELSGSVVTTKKVSVKKKSEEETATDTENKKVKNGSVTTYGHKPPYEPKKSKE